MSLDHELIKDGWFREESDDFPGQSFGLKVKKILYTGKSKFQDVLIFESETFGNVLVLDGIIQVTERDEFAYQEMITHLPMYAHPNPKNVLVIGGGDGGVLREVIKHERVERVTQVEIDETVIELSKVYLPNMSKSYSNEKANVVITDGFQYLKECKEKFDVIITDSSDPEGPAIEFFKENYFQLLNNALNDEGIIISMASENIWLNISKLKDLRLTCLKVFPQVACSLCMIPSYTSGQIALMICGKSKDIELTKANRAVDLKLKYYNENIHRSSFVMPTWADEIINRV